MNFDAQQVGRIGSEFPERLLRAATVFRTIIDFAYSDAERNEEDAMDKEEAFQIAARAVEKLVKEQGIDATFPLDAIWAHADKEVPSVQRPAQARRLVNRGYLELTGAIAKASSAKRAGSPTREYRPGPRFRASRPPAPSAAVADLVEQLADGLDSRGLIVTVPELANFYLALKASPLVFLVGVAGTGKSLLPRVFAELTGALFRRVGVKPQWADDSDLFGYTPSLSRDTFVPGEFTKALLEAKGDGSKLSIVLLDETNLAPVEHYFSEFLSVTETQRRVGGTLITDSFALDLPKPPEGSTDPFAQFRGLQLPPNVRVVGTANMDETTRPFSPKVLDRAFSIELRDIDLESFPSQSASDFRPEQFAALAARILEPTNPLTEAEVYEAFPSLSQCVGQLLEEMRNILNGGRISFAYRTRKAVLLYLWNWKNDGLETVLSLDKAFDYCVLQKVLPKITGSGDDLATALGQLEDWLRQTHDRTDADCPRGPFTESAEKVAEMRGRLASEGATTYWAF